VATVGNPVVFKCYHTSPVKWVFNEIVLNNVSTLDQGRILLLTDIQHSDAGKYYCYSSIYQLKDFGELYCLGKLLHCSMLVSYCNFPCVGNSVLGIVTRIYMTQAVFNNVITNIIFIK